MDAWIKVGIVAMLVWLVGCGVPPSTRAPEPVGPSVQPVPDPPAPRTPTNPPTPPPTQPPTTPPPAGQDDRPDDKPDDPILYDRGSGPWIGDACTQDSDCNYSGGFCLKDSDGYPQGHCSRTCTRYCPDRQGKAFTLCVQNPSGGGYCVSRCDKKRRPTANGCRADYLCSYKPRYNQSSLSRYVCLPKSNPTPPRRDPPPPPPRRDPPQPPPRRDPPQPPPPTVSHWIGEACTQDADCAYDGGLCLTSAAGYPSGTCSKACTTTCPDKAGKPTTFCISTPAGGRCVSQCPGGSCRTGYTCQSRTRNTQSWISRSVCLPPNSSQPPPPPPTGTGKGTLVAKMYITYYYLSQEKNFSGSATTTLYDKSCRPLVKVSAAFSDSVCIEGSGRLKDGRVINYASTCSCGRRCRGGKIICYSILDKSKYPWGAGVRSWALRPLRSLAVDPNKIAYGTKIYIPEWDGVKIPSIDGIGGFTHDGCFRAEDTGGAIRGNHFDFFAGTSTMWKSLEKFHSTRKYLTLYKNPSRCP